MTIHSKSIQIQPQTRFILFIFTPTISSPGTNRHYIYSQSLLVNNNSPIFHLTANSLCYVCNNKCWLPIFSRFGTSIHHFIYPTKAHNYFYHFHIFFLQMVPPPARINVGLAWKRLYAMMQPVSAAKRSMFSFPIKFPVK